MTRMAWIAAAMLAAFVASPVLADDRMTNQDQPSDSGGKGGDAGSGGSSGSGQQGSSGQSQPAQPTMKELLAAGYEVKSTMLVTRDVVKRGGATDSVDAVIITLQNGAALATCYEEFSSFVNDPTTLGCSEYK